MEEENRRKKLDSNWGLSGEISQNSETEPNNDCYFSLSLEKNLYWVNAINTYQTPDEGMKLILELVTICPTFHQQLIKFLRFIGEHSSSNPDQLCFLNILKDGFQACTCFSNDKPEEIKDDLGFLLFVENNFRCYWMFTPEDFKKFLENLELCLSLN